MQELELKFTIEEVNLILEGLGTQPFFKVHQLIGKIQQQASSQIGSQSEVKTNDTAS